MVTVLCLFRTDNHLQVFYCVSGGQFECCWKSHCHPVSLVINCMVLLEDFRITLIFNAAFVSFVSSMFTFVWNGMATGMRSPYFLWNSLTPTPGSKI